MIVGSFGAPRFTQYAEAISDQSIITLTNAQRLNYKERPLIWNGSLTVSALAKAQDICTKGYWGHTSPSGETAWDLMNKNNYDYSFAGENLAKGYTADAAKVDAWMKSPSHKANILDRNYKEMGSASIKCSFKGKMTTITVAHYASR